MRVPRIFEHRLPMRCALKEFRRLILADGTDSARPLQRPLPAPGRNVPSAASTCMARAPNSGFSIGGLPCEPYRISAWSSSSLAALTEKRDTGATQDVGPPSGDGDLELRVSAARKALWPSRKVLTSRSIPWSTRWLRWKTEVGPVAWSWRWTPDVWR